MSKRVRDSDHMVRLSDVTYARLHKVRIKCMAYMAENPHAFPQYEARTLSMSDLIDMLINASVPTEFLNE